MPTTYTIIKGNQYFDATLYTGNVTDRTITNAAGFPAEFVWIKDRSAARQNSLSDIVRGVNKEMFSDSTDADTSPATQVVTAFGPNGFSIGPNGVVNASGENFVAWQWRANGAGVTNTAGSITSTVSANQTSGFSIVTYTGNGSSGTVGHGLGVAPSMIIVKNRSTTADWPVYFSGITSATEVMRLNSTTAKLTGRSEWNSTLPTSTVFSVGNDSAVNTNGNNYVAYCFAEINGYSKFGSYTGNGSTDGPFIYTGFRPRFIITKLSSGAGNWRVRDTARDPYNVSQNILYPNLSDAEVVDNQVDILSNGFKLRNALAQENPSGGTIIYMAFAEMPTKYANAR